jgi:hypothetical protein
MLYISDEWAYRFSKAFGLTVSVVESDSKAVFTAFLEVKGTTIARINIPNFEQQPDAEELEEVCALFHESGHIGIGLSGKVKDEKRLYNFGSNIAEDAIIDTAFAKELDGYKFLHEQNLLKKEEYPKDWRKKDIIGRKRTIGILQCYADKELGFSSFPAGEYTPKEVYYINKIVDKIKSYEKEISAGKFKDFNSYISFCAFMERFILMDVLSPQKCEMIEVPAGYSGIGLDRVINIIRESFRKKERFDDMMKAFESTFKRIRYSASKVVASSGSKVIVRRYINSVGTNDNNVFKASRVASLEFSKWLFLVDISSSTAGSSDIESDIEILTAEKKLVNTIVDSLPRTCELELVVFAGSYKSIYRGRNREAFAEELMTLSANGSTVWSGQLFNYLYKKATNEGVRVVIISDGEIGVDRVAEFTSFLSKGKYKPFIFLFGYSGISGLNLRKNIDYANFNNRTSLGEVTNYMRGVISEIR